MRESLVAGLTLLLLTPSSLAAIDVGPVSVVIENGHGAECAHLAPGACLASARGDDAGSLELDADQRVRLVGVAIDLDAVEDETGIRLLPDDALMIRPSDLFIKHEVYTLMIRHVGRKDAPTPFPAAALESNETGIYVTHPNPRANETDLPPRTNTFRAEFGDTGPEQGPNERHGIRPQQTFGQAQTDWYGRSIQDSPTCAKLVGEACTFYGSQVADVQSDATPNVIVGLSFVEAGLGDDLSDFDREVGPPRAPPSQDPLLQRRSGGALPATQLPPAAKTMPLRTSDPSGPMTPPGTPLQRPHSLAPIAIALAGAPPAPPPAAPSVLLPATAFALAVVLAAFYARIRDRDDALGSARRQAIVAALSEDGPSTIAQLARRLGVDRTTVEHHARHLARTQVARVQKHGRLVVISLPDQVAPKGADTARPPLRRTLLDLLASRGGAVTRAEIEGATPGVPKRTRNHALRELQAAGAIEIVLGQGAPVVRLTRADAA